MVPQADLDFLGAAAPAADVQPLQRAAFRHVLASVEMLLCDS